MANYVLDPEDKIITSTETSYNEVSNEAGSITPMNQSQILLEKYRLGLDKYLNPQNYAEQDSSNKPYTSILRQDETNLKTQTSQILQSMYEQYGQSSRDLYSMYKQQAQDTSRQISQSYAAPAAQARYSALNQAASQYATGQRQIARNIEQQYAAQAQEANAKAQRSLYSDYTMQQSALQKQYASETASFTKQAEEVLSSISKAATDEEVSYQRNLIGLISHIFNVDPESATWREDLITKGWLTEDGQTTQAFDDEIGEFLYGENRLANMVQLGMEDEELAAFAKKYGAYYLDKDQKIPYSSIAESVGMEYSPFKNTGNYKRSNAPELMNATVDKDGKSQVLYITGENNYRFPLNVDYADTSTPKVIRYSDGTEIKVQGGKPINAGGNIDGKINKGYWEYVVETPGDNYGKAMSLEDALERGTLQVGSKFKGLDNNYYVVVYFDHDKVGHSDVAVRKVIN